MSCSSAARRAVVQAKLNLQEAGRGDIDNKKATLLLRLNQFNDAARAGLGDIERGANQESGLGRILASENLTPRDCRVGLSTIISFDRVVGR